MNAVNLEAVNRFRIPRDVVEATASALQAAGAEGVECFALWSGVPGEEAFEVRTLHVPPQRAYRLASGLLVRIDGEALHALNRWLYEHGELLAAQVHSHPTGAYHSDTDETFPVATQLGALSIVVPDFARAGIFSGGTAQDRKSVV